jgi:hypothetical protein
MQVLASLWTFVRTNRFRIIALVLILSFFAPSPANAQFGFIFGLINLVTNGLNALNGVMSNINNALRNVIAPILNQINTVMWAVQSLMQWVFDFQRNTIYPQAAINAARALIGQVQGMYTTMRGYWNIAVLSATLPNPQHLEALILSRNAGQIAAVGGSFEAVYTPLPAAADAHPRQRDLIDSTDAVAQAAMKRAIAIDAIADQELAAADQMMTALQGTAPGTAEMIGAQAGAWLVRSHAYTQQALGELMRIRAIELAAQSARAKEGARYTRETRTKVTEVNR